VRRCRVIIIIIASGHWKFCVCIGKASVLEEPCVYVVTLGSLVRPPHAGQKWSDGCIFRSGVQSLKVAY
jgi:hypothetical protein